MDKVPYDKRRRVAELLRAVANGSTTADQALKLTEEWDNVPWELKLLEDAYHALQHFKIDEDIRIKDEDYARSQLEALRKIASNLDEA
jgi:hypothetical protein